MLKEKLLPISIFCLSISIIISGSIIAKGMKYNGESVNNGLYHISSGLNNINDAVFNNSNNNSINNEDVRKNYNLYEAAEYLGVLESRLKDIVAIEESGIPYIKAGKDYIFNKNALDKWLETARVEVK